MFILRFLQVASLLYVCSLLIEMVSCEVLSAGLDKRAPDIISGNYSVSQVVQRTYLLYNKCSGRHVQILGKMINALGNSNSPNVNLSFVSVHVRHHPTAMNILSQKSGRYLCFNKRGKLIARIHGKKRLCLFKEDFSEFHYTILQSLYDKNWYVGFSSKGKPLNGNQYAKPKMRECFHFVKRNNSLLERPRWPGPHIKDPSKLKDLLKQKAAQKSKVRKIGRRTLET